MNQASLQETLARESVVDASRFIALSGSLEGIGLGASRRLIPEITPSMVKPSRELRPPLLILRGVGVEVSDHEGAFGCIFSHPGP